MHYRHKAALQDFEEEEAEIFIKFV